MEQSLFALTTQDICRLAYDFDTQLNIQHRFNQKMSMVGYHWLCGPP